LVPLENVYFIGNDKNAKIGLINHLKLELFVDDSPSIIDVLNKGSHHIGNKKFKRWKTVGELQAIILKNGKNGILF